MDDNSFASLVSKLNQIDVGRKPQERQFKAKDNHIKEGMKTNDMTSILENLYRDVPFESARTTASDAPFKKDYKPKQLPADYKMPSVGPVLGGDEEEIPTDGYLVGEAQDSLMGVKDPVISISDVNGKPIDRLKMSVAATKYKFDMNVIRPQFLKQDHVKHGQFTLSAPMNGQPMEGHTDADIEDKGEYDQEGEMAKGQLNRAADAALELQSILDDDENLPEWVQNKITKALDYLDTSRDYMKQELDEYTPHPGSEESWDGVSPDTDQTLSGPINPAPKGAQLPEDHVGKKKSILDYLSDVEAKHNEDMLADPVKTFTTDDGKEMKIYRTKDDGYRIKVNGKESKSSFGKLDDAVMACETFVQKSIDYASER